MNECFYTDELNRCSLAMYNYPFIMFQSKWEISHLAMLDYRVVGLQFDQWFLLKKRFSTAPDDVAPRDRVSPHSGAGGGDMEEVLTEMKKFSWILSVSKISKIISIIFIILLVGSYPYSSDFKVCLKLDPKNWFIIDFFCSWTKWTRHVYRTCMGVYNGHVNGGEYNIIMYNNDIPQF
jgi:hypothetical protein